jgi:beta-lactamase class A
MGTEREISGAKGTVGNKKSRECPELCSTHVPLDERLHGWNHIKTGDARLRVGLPKEWRIGDKTGAGEFGTMNEIAAIWPPDGKPLIVTISMMETKASLDDRNAGTPRSRGQSRRC